MALKVYCDRMSQPSRAVLLFCKINGIEFEEIHIDVINNKHLTPEYKAINPMCQLPAIVNGEFKLFESHAILIYLSCAFPEIASHWYPTDISKRSKIHSVLDWHHTNLRRGTGLCSGFSLNDSVYDLIDNGTWRWPPDWFTRYPELSQGGRWRLCIRLYDELERCVVGLLSSGDSCMCIELGDGLVSSRLESGLRD
ncbi:glutathione S-transferase [Artemisia annua]|uniref:Glutathione S-transferase n=1 Tax=Artemisia annua TaxID=35608 RepID=A0A2U1MR83_ARTAN|nr:glutathione S-transferase [Artemisia annua]